MNEFPASLLHSFGNAVQDIAIVDKLVGVARAHVVGNSGEVPAVVQLVVERLCERSTGHYGGAVMGDILPHNGVQEEKSNTGITCKRKGSKHILCFLYRSHRMRANFYEPGAFDAGAPSEDLGTRCAFCYTAKE